MGVIAALGRAGIPAPAVIGPAASALRDGGGMSVRQISFLELLIPRGQALPAAEALAALGWTLAPGQSLPRLVEFDHIEGIWFRNGAGEGLRLAWRLFPAPPEYAAEWESLPPFEAVEFQAATLLVPSRDVMLAYTLVSESAADHFDWRCDAGLLLDGGAIDWTRVGKWIQFSPAARMRLLQLADKTGAAVPSSLRRRPARLWFQWNLVWADYERHVRTRGETRSSKAFFRYLCERWQVSAWQMPFFGLFYLLRYTFPRRPAGE
jgi:hypothetical protein